ncbi:DUF3093 domain-containing protein [Marmoricola endophyticus]|uniref:DUF3093 domain-containing protein n=1 Tax=Marmoricola endophyticus TaxID=2040280 RepID=UPI001E5D82BA|nr:DUF3093 domain-containing protein [Marmoricola endophyticus]
MDEDATTAGGAQVASRGSYSERLTAPLRWYVQGTMLLATLWLAMIVAIPSVVAWAVTAALAALGYAMLFRLGSARIAVTGGELLAGRARIPVSLLGGAEALDAEGTRRVLGVDADVRAFLLTRPYLKRSVRVTLTDPDDPTPYWLLSTRRPERLARAVESARTRS